MSVKLLILSFALLIILPCDLFAAKGSSKNEWTAMSRPDSMQTDIAAGVKAFSHLSKSERKSRIKEMKKKLKEFKALKKAGGDIDTNTLLLVILSILIPPLAVYLHEGETNNRFWISVLLTLLGYVLFGFAGIFFLGSLPGIIYALIVVLSN